MQNTRNQLILSYQPLVHQVARQYLPVLRSFSATALTLDDLIQEGNLGLIYAIDRQLAPMSFILKFILEALRRYANILSIPCHVPTTNFVTVPTDMPVPSDDEALTLADTLTDDVTPYSSIVQREDLQNLRQAFARLSPREQYVVSRTYGINCKPLTNEQLTTELAISNTTLKKIRKKSQKKLAKGVLF